MNNIPIMGVPEEERGREWVDSPFEKIMAENLPNLRKKMNIQIQEAQRTQTRMNPKRPKSKTYYKQLVKS